MQGAARTLMLVTAVITAAVALVMVFVEPAVVGLVLAVSAAIAWCRFLERSVHRPW